MLPTKEPAAFAFIQAAPGAQALINKTWSVRCAAVFTMRLVLHEGHTPRPLKEKATKFVVLFIVGWVAGRRIWRLSRLDAERISGTF